MATQLQPEFWPEAARASTAARPRELPGNFATPPHPLTGGTTPRIAVEPSAKRWRTNAIRRVIRSLVTNRLAPTKACRECGWAVVYSALAVDIQRTKVEASFSGLVQCRNRWLCPVCAARRAREEGDALRAMLGELRRKGGRAYLATLTVPHAIHQDIQDVRTTISSAWRPVANGNPWKRFLGEYHFSGAVRALEVTHGSNGWHPHLHVLLFARRPLSAGALAEARKWLSDRWGRHVERRGWPQPDSDIGVTLKASSDDAYVTKMGLAAELVGAQQKRGRVGGRTPWQIALDIALARMEGSQDASLKRDTAIWKDYARGMRGAQQLTYTRGLRERYTRTPDAVQEELALDDARGPDAETVLTVPLHIWNDHVRHDVRLQLDLLRGAERGMDGRDLRYLIDREAAKVGDLLFWNVKLPPPRRKNLPLARYRP